MGDEAEGTGCGVQPEEKSVYLEAWDELEDALNELVDAVPDCSEPTLADAALDIALLWVRIQAMEDLMDEALEYARVAAAAGVGGHA